MTLKQNKVLSNLIGNGYDNFLELLLDSSSTYVYICSKDHVIEFMNRAHIERLGYDATGEKCYKALHGLDKPCDWCINERVFNGESVRKEVQSPKDGRYFTIINTPLYKSGGEVSKLSVAMDITSSVCKVIPSIYQSRKQIERIFKESKDPMMLLTTDTYNIVDVNQRATALFGYKKQELIEKGISTIFRKDVLPQIIKNLSEQDFETESCLCINNVEVITQNGGSVITNLRFTPAILENESLIVCTVSGDGLTLPSETKTEIINVDRKSLLGMLAGGVFHEINNPNNFIMFNSLLLIDLWQDIINEIEKRCCDGAENRIGDYSVGELKTVFLNLLKGIVENSKRIATLRKNIMGLLQNNVVTDNDVDINKVVRFSVNILDYQIKRHTDRFQLKLGRHIPYIKGNPHLLEQVVMNLIMNALQALPGRDRKVMVSTNYCKESDYIVLKVQDEGEGIDPSLLKKIFEPFFSTKCDTGGTGLGLYISEMIVEEHRGTIEFTSKPQYGTCVTVRLPVSNHAH